MIQIGLQIPDVLTLVFGDTRRWFVDVREPVAVELTLLHNVVVIVVVDPIQDRSVVGMFIQINIRTACVYPVHSLLTIGVRIGDQVVVYDDSFVEHELPQGHVDEASPFVVITGDTIEHKRCFVLVVEQHRIQLCDLQIGLQVCVYTIYRAFQDNKRPIVSNR